MFYVKQKSVRHTGLKQLEGEYMMTAFTFLSGVLLFTNEFNNMTCSQYNFLRMSFLKDCSEVLKCKNLKC